METTVSTAPFTISRRAPAVIAAVLWLAVGVTAWLSSVAEDEDWHLPYLLLVLSIVSASSLTLLLAARVTRDASSAPAQRTLWWVSLAVGVLGILVAFVIAWAYVLWAALLALATFGLAANGRRDGRWVALLGGLFSAGIVSTIAVALLKVGDPGTYDDHSQTQMWVQAVSAVGLAAVLGWRATRPRTGDAA